MENSTLTINQISINIITEKPYDDSEDYFKAFSAKFLKQFDLTCINLLSNKFKPHGITLISILSESHFAIHTWPEKNSIHIDLVSCKKIESKEVIEYIKKEIPNIKSIQILVDSMIEL